MEIRAINNDQEINQLLRLHKKNLRTNLTNSEQKKNGFVTAEYDFDLIKKMNSKMSQIIASDNGNIIAYALSLSSTLEDFKPDLKPLFDSLIGVSFNGRQIKDFEYYIMGQICIDVNHRGKGIFDKLYELHKTRFKSDYEICVTEVATRNFVSMKAHLRVGFKNIHTYADDIDEWNILVWDWK